jgi:hypothetical protein
VGDPRHAVGQFGSGGRRHTGKVGGERHLLHLFVGRQRQFLAAIADIDVPQPGHTVEHFAPVGGVQPNALGAVHYEGVVMYGGVLKGMKLLLIALDYLFVIEYGGRYRGHVCFS